MDADLCLREATVVLPDRLARHHSVWVRDGRILTVAPDDALEPAEGVRVVDLSGLLLGPGFVDIHCHAGGGAWAWEDPARAARAHLSHGTTTMLATTALAPDHAGNVEAVRAIARAIESGEAPSLAGIHMEGPYLNPDFGAFREHSRTPSAAEADDLAEAGDGWLRLMTIAPELDGAAEFVHHLQSLTGGAMTFAVGHSRATREQIEALVPGGLRVATHFANATGATPDPSRDAGTREVGVDESVLLDDGIWAEVIADSTGRHVRPDMIRLALKVKGPDRLIAVTDCTNAASSSDGSDVCLNDRGELAGSALTMDRAVANLILLCGVPVEVAWRLASHNPAAALGMLGEVGQILPGRRANLVVANADWGFAVEQVWLDGAIVTEGEQP